MSSGLGYMPSSEPVCLPARSVKGQQNPKRMEPLGGWGTLPTGCCGSAPLSSSHKPLDGCFAYQLSHLRRAWAEILPFPLHTRTHAHTHLGRSLDFCLLLETQRNPSRSSWTWNRGHRGVEILAHYQHPAWELQQSRFPSLWHRSTVVAFCGKHMCPHLEVHTPLHFPCFHPCTNDCSFLFP